MKIAAIGLSKARLQDLQCSSLLEDAVELCSGFDGGSIAEDRVCAFVSSATDFSSSGSSFAELVAHSNNPIPVVRVLATATFEVGQSEAEALCVDLLERLSNGLTSGSMLLSLASKIFDDITLLFTYCVRKSISPGAESAFKEDLFGAVCNFLFQLMRYQPNRKKLFQVVAKNILPHFLDIMSHSSSMNSTTVRAATNLLEFGIFDPKDLEDIANLSPRERSKSAKQSYHISLFEAIEAYCSLDSLKDRSLLSTDGFAAFVSIHAECSRRLYDAGLQTMVANAVGIKHGSSSTQSSSQLWRQHCVRVLHMCVGLLDILNTKVMISSTNNIWLWSTKANNSILTSLVKALPGSLPQHQSIDGFMTTLKRMAADVMNRLHARDREWSATNVLQPRKMKKKSKTKTKQLQDEEQEQPVENENREHTANGLLQVIIADLETLVSLLHFDHRIVLSSEDVSSSMEEEEPTGAAGGEVAGGDWAVGSATLLVEALVNCAPSTSSHGGAADDARIIFDADLLVQLNDKRLEVLTLVLNTYSDLRRLDIFVKVLVAASNKNDRPDLEQLLSNHAIQSQLSRMMMSLSPVQMVNVWNSITIFGGSQAASNGTTTMMSPCWCAPVLLEAIVSATLAASEINTASLSLHSLIKILSQCMNLLKRTNCDEAHVLLVDRCVATVAQLSAIIVSRFDSITPHGHNRWSAEEIDMMGTHGVPATLNPSECWSIILSLFHRFTAHVVSNSREAEAENHSRSKRLESSRCKVLLALAEFYLNAQAAKLSLNDANSDLLETCMASVFKLVATSGTFGDCTSQLVRVAFELLLKLRSLNQFPPEPRFTNMAIPIFRCLIRFAAEPYQADSIATRSQLEFVHEQISSTSLLDDSQLCIGLELAIVAELDDISNLLVRYHSNLNENVGSSVEPQMMSSSKHTKRKRSGSADSQAPIISEHVGNLSTLERGFRNGAHILRAMNEWIPTQQLTAALLSQSAGCDVVSKKMQHLCAISRVASQLTSPQVDSVEDSSQSPLESEYIAHSLNLVCDILIRLVDQKSLWQFATEVDVIQLTLHCVTDIHRFLSKSMRFSGHLHALKALQNLVLGVYGLNPQRSCEELTELVQCALTPIVSVFSVLSNSLGNSTETAAATNYSAEYFVCCCDLFDGLCHLSSASAAMRSLFRDKLTMVNRLLVRVVQNLNDTSDGASMRKQRTLAMFSGLFPSINVDGIYGWACSLAVSCMQGMFAGNGIQDEMMCSRQAPAIASNEDDTHTVSCLRNIFPVCYINACPDLYGLTKLAGIQQTNTIMETVKRLEGNCCGWLGLLGTCLSIDASLGFPLQITESGCLEIIASVRIVMQHLDHLECWKEGSKNTISGFYRHLDIDFALATFHRGIIRHVVSKNNANLFRHVALMWEKHASSTNMYLLGCITAIEPRSTVAVLCSVSCVEVLLVHFKHLLEYQSQDCREILVWIVTAIKCACGYVTSCSVDSRGISIRILKAMVYGFNIFRALNINVPKRPTVGEEETDEKDAHAHSLFPALWKEEITSKWCNASLNILSSLGFGGNKSIVLQLSVVESIAQQSKFKNLASSLAPFTHLLSGLVLAAAESGDVNICRCAARTMSVCCSNMNLKKHAALIVTGVLQQLANGRSLNPVAFSTISLGLFSLLDKCGPKDRKRIHSMLNHAGRVMLEDIHSNYSRNFKFTGKS